MAEETFNNFFKKTVVPKNMLESLYNESDSVYPDKWVLGNCFSGLKMQDLKVVILGESPFKTGANGLAYSSDIPALSKSLKNIYIELKNDTGIQNRSSNLIDWKYQGILLLNCTQTLDTNNGNSNIHDPIWNPITNKMISELSKQSKFIVFVLWGNKAIAKSKLIDKRKHRILTCSHPREPTFIGNGHFSRINDLLRAKGLTEINWKIE